MKRYILFISHEASYTGAPIVLLHLLKWMVNNTDLTPIVLLQERGPMQSEFEAVAQTIYWKREGSVRTWKQRFFRTDIRENEAHQRKIVSFIKYIQPKIIYANTVVASNIGIFLADAVNCPVCCHVHELYNAIKIIVGDENFINISKRIDFFISASVAVSKNLHESYGIDLAKIHTIHEFINIINFDNEKKVRSNIRQELQIPDNAIVVVASGILEWRKAPELFIQIAQQTQESCNKMPFFIWIGGDLQSDYFDRVLFDLSKAGLDKHVQFLGYKKNIHEYISAGDIFALTSREDPYPLVCLEAASLSKPIICFANSGGMPEFVESDCGFVVPYLRIDLFAAAIKKLCNNEEMRLKFGYNAARKVRANHTVDNGASAILKLLVQLSDKL